MYVGRVLSLRNEYKEQEKDNCFPLESHGRFIILISILSYFYSFNLILRYKLSLIYQLTFLFEPSNTVISILIPNFFSFEKTL